MTDPKIILLLSEAHFVFGDSHVQNLLSDMLMAVGFSWQLSQGQVITGFLPQLNIINAFIAAGETAHSFARDYLPYIQQGVFISHPRMMIVNPLEKKEAWKQLRDLFS